MDLKRKKPITILKDGVNEIIFKPSTKKVVIGFNVGSRFKHRYISFKCKSKEEAEKIGIDYINKKTRKK